MKARGKIIAVKGNQARIELDTDKMKAGDQIEVKIGKPRSLRMNAFYWVYLTYVINQCGLKEQGFFCPEALHESLKAHFLSQKEYKKGKFKTFFVGSTADLTSKDMTEYMEKIDAFMCEFFNIDTHKFFEEYQEVYSRY